MNYKYKIIIILLFAIILFQPNFSFANISGVKSYISNGEIATVFGGNFGGSTSLFYIGNAEKWVNCTKTTKQEISGTVSWNGPNHIILNTSGFSKGEKAYLFHANSVDDLDSSVPGYPIVIESPNIEKCENSYSSDGVYHIKLKGSGFTYNEGVSKVYIGNSDIWNNSDIKTEQEIVSWELDRIDFKFTKTNLDSLVNFYVYVIDGNGDMSNACSIKRVNRPNVYNVIGKISNSEKITINGNNFGEKERAQSVLWDNFENGAIGNEWDNVNPLWEIYSEQGQPSGSQHVLRADRSLASSVDLEKDVDSGPGDFLYVFLKRRWDYTFSDKNQKFFRYWQSEGSQSIAWSGLFYDEPNPNWSYMMRDSYTRHTKYGIMGDWYFDAIPETFPTDDKSWRMEEFFTKIESGVDNCDGIMGYRVNNNLHRKFVTDRCMWTNDNFQYPFRRLYVDNYGQCRLSGEGACINNDQCCFSAGDYIWVDDVYIDNTWARVMIGNQPVYDDCDKIEIQPAVAWSDNSLSINFNQGSFQDGEHVYIFVINKDNIPSNGYPITIGETISDPTPITYNLSNFTSLVTSWLGIGDNNSDVNNDGIVNTRDLGIMMSGWGE